MDETEVWVKIRAATGKHKSKPPESLEGRNTRPTMDKVKEDIFSSLYEVYGLDLDLFAGSSALGIEALSRGMDKVISVDQNFKAVKMIQTSSKQSNLEEQFKVYKNGVDRTLKTTNKRNVRFNFIFLGPPYDKGLIDGALDQISKFDLLREHGIIIYEFNNQEKIDTYDFEVVKQYHYGLTNTLLLKKGEHNDQDESSYSR